MAETPSACECDAIIRCMQVKRNGSHGGSKRRAREAWFTEHRMSAEGSLKTLQGAGATGTVSRSGGTVARLQAKRGGPPRADNADTAAEEPRTDAMPAA